MPLDCLVIGYCVDSKSAASWETTLGQLREHIPVVESHLITRGQPELYKTVFRSDIHLPKFILDIQVSKLAGVNRQNSSRQINFRPIDTKGGSEAAHLHIFSSFSQIDSR